MFSFAVDEGEIPFNPLIAIGQAGRRRGRKRKVARERPQRDPVAVDPAAWFLVMEYLRRPTTPYDCRHTFISWCLQAQIPLATIESWCGTSIQMISETYGRMIRRYEGMPAVPLDDQLETANLEAMSLLSAPRANALTTKAGSTNGSTAAAAPRGPARKRAICSTRAISSVG